ncbi:MAG: hypothetical protein WCD81_02130 [Candidatus Bathyarchaeia archaeon]
MKPKQKKPTFTPQDLRMISNLITIIALDDVEAMKALAESLREEYALQHVIRYD